MESDSVAKGAVNPALLQESAEELYEQAPCGYLSTDTDGWIVKVNQTFLSWTGYERAELVRTSRFPDLLTVGGRIYYDTHFTLLLRMHGVANEIALDLACKDGRRLPVLLSAVQRKDADGRPLLNRITLFDATERRRYEQELVQARRRAEQVSTELAKANEELKRTNADLEQFAYSASHDLREPLRMVTMYSQLLQRRYQGQLDAQADEFLGFAVQGAKRMEALISDLLAYTQAATVTTEQITPIDGDVVLNQALSNLRKAIQESGATVERAPLPYFQVQPVHLLQLFQNLVGNALKYRGDRPPAIRISMVPEGDFWKVCIHDNGIGIDPKYTDQVFGLFRRLHTAENYSGTGIGLAICQKIVHRYGGRIWVQSEGDGKGSIFCFTLPGVENAS